MGGLPEDSARARRIGWAFALGTTLLHLVLAGRYDYHRDELYFIECGRHLAFGYVDHPSFVPFVARIADAGFGANLYALRFLPALASGVSIFLAARFVRELGGGWLATLLVCSSLSAAPAYQRMGAILCIPVFEPMLWTLASLFVWQILNGRSPRRWLWVGLVVGIGLHDKHSMLLWVAGIAGGLALTKARRELLTPWPLLGLVTAFVVFAPNLVWQYQHDFATLTFLRNMSRTTLAGIPAHLFLLGQLLFMNPFTAPIWILGLVSLLRGDVPRRVLGLAFVVVVALLVTHGKPYYLAPAYPVLLAAGATAFERRFATRRALTRVAVGVLVLSGITFGLVGLPILPVTSIDHGLRVGLAGLVKPEELTRELHDQFGFREQVDVVAGIVASLPEDDRARALVLTGNYGEASAVNFFGASRGLPRAITGHMNYWLWGVPPGKGDIVIAYGMPKERIDPMYADVREVARMDHPLAMPEERGLPVYVARAPRVSLAAAWPRFLRYQHGR